MPKNSFGYPYLLFCSLVGFCLLHAILMVPIPDPTSLHANHPYFVLIAVFPSLMLLMLAGGGLRQKMEEPSWSLRKALAPALAVTLIIIARNSILFGVAGLFRWTIFHTYFASVLIVGLLRRRSIGWLYGFTVLLYFWKTDLTTYLEHWIGPMPAAGASLTRFSVMHAVLLLFAGLPFLLWCTKMRKRPNPWLGAGLLLLSLALGFLAISARSPDLQTLHKIRYLPVFALIGDHELFHSFPLLAWFPTFAFGYILTDLLIHSRKPWRDVMILASIGLCYRLATDGKAVYIAYALKNTVAGSEITLTRDEPGLILPSLGFVFMLSLPVCYWLAGRFRIEKKLANLGRSIFVLYLATANINFFKWLKLPKTTPYWVSIAAAFTLLFSMALLLAWLLDKLIYSKRFEIIVARREPKPGYLT